MIDGETEIFEGDIGVGVGLAMLADECRKGWEKGIGGIDLVKAGGSIKLAIDGDALARLADRGGVGDTGGALKGLCASVAGSVVVERTGS